jgi:tetratricopeptide (TPR) repeat protein
VKGQLSASKARELMRLDDLDGAAAVVNASFQECGDEGFSTETWLLRFIRADLLRLRGRTEEALSYLTAVQTAFPPNEADLCSLIGLKKTRGYCLGQLGRYPASHGYLGEAEQLAGDAGLLEMQCEVRQCQAMVFYLQRDYQSSDLIFRLILAAAPQIGGWYFRASALWGIGKNLMIQGNHEAALPWLEQSLALFESVGARLSIAIVWGGVPGKFCTSGNETNWYGRSLEWHEESGIHLSRS